MSLPKELLLGGKFAELAESLESMEDLAWRLLVLERDLSGCVHLDTPEVNEQLRQYRTYSMELFGQVRTDRTEESVRICREAYQRRVAAGLSE